MKKIMNIIFLERSKKTFTTYLMNMQIINKKKTIRINISIIDKILNKKIKSFLNKNAFLQQLIINNRSVLSKQSGKNIFI